MFQKQIPIISIIPRIIASLMLFGALAHWPYGYYQILRWVVCGVGIYTVYLAFESEKIGWAIVFGIIAILFNPILPIHLTRQIWQPIDVIVGILFIVSIIFVRKSLLNKTEGTASKSSKIP